MKWPKVIDKLREMEIYSRKCADHERSSIRDGGPIWTEEGIRDTKRAIDRHEMAAYIFGGLANALHEGLK